VEKSILVVDNSKAVRDAVRSLIENEQSLAVCGEAVDGLDAIAKVQKLKPDLVLLDVALPKLNGVETATVIKRHSPKVRVILLALHETAVDALAQAVGIDVVLSKPEGIA
jgi:CheY-like chemotaxis protein